MAIAAAPTKLDGVRILQPVRHKDNRGWFEESWSRRALIKAGIDAEFVQDNHSASDRTGTLRGMHCQTPPDEQSKLVRCTRGAILDVVFDLRTGSPTFEKWQAFELGAENGLQLFIPAGLLHGFMTLHDDTHVQYRTSAYYSPEAELTVRWDSLGIEWPNDVSPILSDRDRHALPYSQIVSPFMYGGAK